MLRYVPYICDKSNENCSARFSILHQTVCYITYKAMVRDISLHESNRDLAILAQPCGFTQPDYPLGREEFVEQHKQSKSNPTEIAAAAAADRNGRMYYFFWCRNKTFPFRIDR